MPRIYRAMLSKDARPEVGNSKNMLGVRVPPAELVDIVPDAEGNVTPCGKGMSVNPTLTAMPLVFVPRRWRELDKKFRGARGDTPLEVFCHGEGEFVSGTVAPKLVLNPDKPTHGVVQPETRMAFTDYLDALKSTQNDWVLLDSPDGS